MKLLVLLLLISCGKSKPSGYGCITRAAAILTCRSYAALKYQNPTLEAYQDQRCQAIYPADVCYQTLYHEGQI